MNGKHCTNFIYYLNNHLPIYTCFFSSKVLEIVQSTIAIEILEKGMKKFAKRLSVAPHVTSQLESFLWLPFSYASVSMFIISPCLVSWHLEGPCSLHRVLAQQISSGLSQMCTTSKILNSILRSRLGRWFKWACNTKGSYGVGSSVSSDACQLWLLLSIWVHVSVSPLISSLFSWDRWEHIWNLQHLWYCNWVRSSRWDTHMHTT